MYRSRDETLGFEAAVEKEPAQAHVPSSASPVCIAFIQNVTVLDNICLCDVLGNGFAADGHEFLHNTPIEIKGVRRQLERGAVFQFEKLAPILGEQFLFDLWEDGKDVPYGVRRVFKFKFPVSTGKLGQRLGGVVPH